MMRHACTCVDRIKKRGKRRGEGAEGCGKGRDSGEGCVKRVCAWPPPRKGPQMAGDTRGSDTVHTRYARKGDYINQLTGYGLRRHTYPQTLQWTIKRKHATIYAYRDAAARELSGGDVLQTVVAQRDALHRRPELYLEEGVAQPGQELSGRLLVEAEREHGWPRLPPARLGDRLVRVRVRVR